ncbi:ThiF family adenylyltransferase [Nocardioides sp. REDSEA-S30_B4]|jgi:molybdopterin/thiamine biosynthesis adenylyltransferase|uniref:HesA/MoeB/ThiF family protein n=1 Tax=Nocardioides sp. REDSEA-S30_B4 TaxID=1811552 RepID=UPI000A912DFE|nr:ThiF family adenylyltransferase [Nocardioides sp. REDSEA-S30_B4]
MTVNVYPGWPLRYAHIHVDGLRTDHAAGGTICLWAEDDPAQVQAQDLDVLLTRLDEWATAAQSGFNVEDRALDAYMLFDKRNGKHHAELPLSDILLLGGNGYMTALAATVAGSGLVRITTDTPDTKDTEDSDKPRLRGAFYLRNNIGPPPRSLTDIEQALTRRQREDLQRGLDARQSVAIAEVSGGYDFIVLAWPRHDREHDAIVIAFAGAGPTLQAAALPATSNDIAARKRRAGPDADALSDKTVLVAGVGSVGGHVALALACSGVGTLRLHDDDDLTSGNLVRHVCDDYLVGYMKTIGVSITIKSHAPWTTVDKRLALPHAPDELAEQIRDVDLVVDCTGTFHVTAALAERCRRNDIPLITGALYHQGSLARIRRQANGDTPIAARRSNPAYQQLPPEEPTAPHTGFLELGCTAPVNNAPPIAVLATAADIAHAAVDLLTGRRDRPDERTLVFRPIADHYPTTGTFDGPPGPSTPSP